MKRLIAIARALPKFDHILLMTREERLKLIKNGCYMIFESSLEFVAWLISHLMVKSSASVLMIFLTLVFVITRACKRILKYSIAKLSSC